MAKAKKIRGIIFINLPDGTTIKAFEIKDVLGEQIVTRFITEEEQEVYVKKMMEHTSFVMSDYYTENGLI